MSYEKKFVVSKNIFLKKLKPCSNLIVFVLNDNFYIPVSRDDLAYVMKSGKKHYNEDTNKLQTFYKVVYQIAVDESLENCFKNRNNTMKLEVKGEYRIGFGENKKVFNFYGVTPLERKEILKDKEQTEKSSFDEIVDNEKRDEIENDSENETEKQIDWNEVKRQDEERKEKQLKQEEKRTGNYSRTEFFEENNKKVMKYENFVLKSETWFRNDLIHRESKEDHLPAYIEYYESGNIAVKKWYKEGKLHRINEPAWLEWYESGEKKAEGWYQEDICYMNDEGKGLPFVTYYHENGNKQLELWFQNGEDHRDHNLPSHITYYKNGNKEHEGWYRNGKRYRDPKVEPSGEIINLPVWIKYYENGNKEYEIWCNENGHVHRGNLPAQIFYYKNGNIRKEEWYRNGEIYRESDLPTSIIYNENGNKEREKWFNKNHECYRENGLPTVIEYYENNEKIELWYKNKNIHRDNDLPAWIRYDKNGNKKSEERMKNGIYFHYDENDLPSYISYFENGNKASEKWFNHGQFHREHGLPAYVQYYENGNKRRETWYRNGEKYRNPKIESNGKITDLPTQVEYEDVVEELIKT